MHIIYWVGLGILATMLLGLIALVILDYFFPLKSQRELSLKDFCDENCTEDSNLIAPPPEEPTTPSAPKKE